MEAETIELCQHDIPMDQPCQRCTAILDTIVDHPPHYTHGQVECIQAIESALTPEEFRGFCKGVALKYLWRCNYKGGDDDLRKAQWYLRRLVGEPR